MKHLKLFENFNNLTYFAHPISMYKTDIEKECMQILKEYNFDSLNPSDYQEDFNKYRENHPTGYMAYFKGLVDKCSSVSYLPFSDGSIGAGIVYEAEYGHSKGYNIYEIDYINKSIKKVDINHVIDNQLSIDDTRKKLATKQL